MDALDKCINFMNDALEAYEIICANYERVAGHPKEILKLLKIISMCRLYSHELEEELKMLETKWRHTKKVQKQNPLLIDVEK